MMRLFRWIIDDYISSQRILVEWGAAIAIPYLLLASHTDAASTLATWSLSTLALALYTTSVIADIAEQPINISRLLHLPSRRQYIAAYLFAAFLIVLSAYVILVAATFIFAPVAFPAWQLWLASLPALIVLIITGIVMMMLLTPLVASPLQRLTLLAVFAIPLTWDRVIALLPDMLPGNIMAMFHAVSTVHRAACVTF